MTTRNFGIATGRIVSIKYFDCQNGGRIAAVKLAVKRDYIKKGQKEPESDFPEFRQYIAPQGSAGPLSFLNPGDLVSVTYTLRTSVTEKSDGSREYYQTCQVEAGGIDVLEPRAVRDARQEAKAAG